MSPIPPYSRVPAILWITQAWASRMLHIRNLKSRWSARNQGMTMLPLTPSICLTSQAPLMHSVLPVPQIPLVPAKPPAPLASVPRMLHTRRLNCRCSWNNQDMTMRGALRSPALGQQPADWKLAPLVVSALKPSAKLNAAKSRSDFLELAFQQKLEDWKADPLVVSALQLVAKLNSGSQSSSCQEPADWKAAPLVVLALQPVAKLCLGSRLSFQ